MTILDIENKEEGLRNSIYLMDGFDKEKNIGFEFISLDDVSPSVGEIDLLMEANKYRDSITGKTDGKKVGILYDPGQGTVEEGKIISRKEALKLQVRDFIQWLKNNGSL